MRNRQPTCFQLQDGIDCGMFSLLYGLWEYVWRKEELRILILGLDKAGKTSLLEKLKELCTGSPGLEPASIVPTVGLNVGRVEAHHAQLLFWDLGGQAGLRSIWDKYFADSHALIFVVDSTRPARFEEARAALFRALSSRELYGAPVLMLANKQDAPDAQPPAAVQQMLGLDELKVPLRVQEASATTGEGLRDGLQWLVTEIRRSDRASLLRQRL
ncbi:ADP-ribosylation factor-related protein 1 [Coccomyxa sp. Obi]|nr:ADP-ribosylation factor-related protein 1 [Coccomyxa sp. Obi]